MGGRLVRARRAGPSPCPVKLARGHGHAVGGICVGPGRRHGRSARPPSKGRLSALFHRSPHSHPAPSLDVVRLRGVMDAVARRTESRFGHISRRSHTAWPRFPDPGSLIPGRDDISLVRHHEIRMNRTNFDANRIRRPSQG